MQYDRNNSDQEGIHISSHPCQVSTLSTPYQSALLFNSDACRLCCLTLPSLAASIEVLRRTIIVARPWAISIDTRTISDISISCLLAAQSVIPAHSHEQCAPTRPTFKFSIEALRGLCPVRRGQPDRLSIFITCFCSGELRDLGPAISDYKRPKKVMSQRCNILS